MVTAEREAVVGSPDLDSLTPFAHRARLFDRPAGIEAISTEGPRLQ